MSKNGVRTAGRSQCEGRRTLPRAAVVSSAVDFRRATVALRPSQEPHGSGGDFVADCRSAEHLGLDQSVAGLHGPAQEVQDGVDGVPANQEPVSKAPALDLGNFQKQLFRRQAAVVVQRAEHVVFRELRPARRAGVRFLQ